MTVFHCMILRKVSYLPDSDYIQFSHIVFFPSSAALFLMLRRVSAFCQVNVFSTYCILPLAPFRSVTNIAAPFLMLRRHLLVFTGYGPPIKHLCPPSASHFQTHTLTHCLFILLWTIVPSLSYFFVGIVPSVCLCGCSPLVSCSHHFFSSQHQFFAHTSHLSHDYTTQYSLHPQPIHHLSPSRAGQ